MCGLLLNCLQVVLQSRLVGRLDGHAFRASADVGELLSRLACFFELFQLLGAFAEYPQATIFNLGDKARFIVLAGQGGGGEQANDQLNLSLTDAAEITQTTVYKYAEYA